MMMETKRCRTCLKWKPLDMFDMDADKKNGRRATCKACRGKAERRAGRFSKYELMMMDNFKYKDVLGGLDFGNPRRVGQLFSKLCKEGLVKRISIKKPYFYKITKKGKKRLDKELETEIMESRQHIKNFRMLQDEFDLHGVELLM